MLALNLLVWKMSENVPRIEMLFVWTVVSLNGTVLNEKEGERESRT